MAVVYYKDGRADLSGRNDLVFEWGKPVDPERWKFLSNLDYSTPKEVTYDFIQKTFSPIKIVDGVRVVSSVDQFEAFCVDKGLKREYLDHTIRVKSMIRQRKLKPCPLCGRPVKAMEERSRDGTVVWIRIHHGPQIPCGISFLAYPSEAMSKWNQRVKDDG